MKILLDHCVPKRFGKLLVGHFVRTCEFMEWDNLKNGALLATAAPEFDALLTVDKNLRHQQNLLTLPIPVIALDAVTNQPHVLAPFAPKVLRLLEEPLEMRVYLVTLDLEDADADD